MLRFQCNSAVLGIMDSALTCCLVPEEVAGIHLQARLIRIDRHAAAGFGMGEFCNKAKSLPQERPIMIIPRGKHQLLMFAHNVTADPFGQIEVKRPAFYRTQDTNRDQRLVNRQIVAGMHSQQVVENGLNGFINS